MRAQKLIVISVLGSMLLGTAGSLVARQNVTQPTAQAIEAKWADFKASLAKAVSAAEKDLSGIAKSVRIDLSQGELRWIVGVVTAGRMHDVVVDHGGTVIIKTAQAVPLIQPEMQSATTAKAAPVRSGGSLDVHANVPPVIAPVSPVQGKAS